MVIISVCYFNVDNLFSTKIKDSGYAVFDFVKIGNKSKAPIISQTEGRVSKAKSKNENTEMEITKSLTNPPPPKKNSTEEKGVTINKKSKNHKTKNNKPKDNKSRDNNSKKQDKAIVNLGKNKNNKKSPSNSKLAQKSLDSLLDSAIADSEQENSGLKAEEIGETLTATQVDLIRQNFKKCWHFPAGLKNAEDLVVDIKIELNQDGYVKKAEIVNKDKMSQDKNFQIAAENAYRAVLDPDCNPLPLSKEICNQYKELELSFNPKNMFEN